MRAHRVMVILAAIVLAASSAAADVRLEFRQGRVTLLTHDASIQQILSEWTRIGGTEIVHADQLSSAPIAIELNGVPENQALDILLHSAAGYLAIQRPSDASDRSAYGRVVILAVSTPAASLASSATSSPLPPKAAPPSRVVRGPRFGPGASTEEATNGRGGTAYRVPGIAPSGPSGTNVPGMIAPTPRRPIPPGPFPGGEPVYPEAPPLPMTPTRTDNTGASSPAPGSSSSSSAPREARPSR